MRNWTFLPFVVAAPLLLFPTVARAQSNGDFNNVAAKSTSIPNWTDPLAFGAKCDGISNDTAALQTAINQTPAGGSLYLPQGSVCLVSATLNISKAINSTAPAGRAACSSRPLSAPAPT